MKRYIIKVRDLKQIINEVVNNNFNLKESNADELFKLPKDQIALYLFKKYGKRIEGIAERLFLDLDYFESPQYNGFKIYDLFEKREGPNDIEKRLEKFKNELFHMMPFPGSVFFFTPSSQEDESLPIKKVFLVKVENKGL